MSTPLSLLTVLDIKIDVPNDRVNKPNSLLHFNHLEMAEDLYADPNSCCNRILRHLGLEPFDLPDPRPRNSSANRASLSPAAEAELRAYYAPHNARLAELLGRDLPWASSTTD